MFGIASGAIRVLLAAIAVDAALAVSVSASAQSVPAALKAELAPTGTLRAAINYNNPLLAQRDAATGKLKGLAVDLSEELARRAGIPVELVPYEAAGKISGSAGSGAWDIACLAIDPARAAEIDFTAAYIELEGTYLVPAGSPLQNIADVDREGVRIAVTSGSAYDLFLSRELNVASDEQRHDGAPLPGKFCDPYHCRLRDDCRRHRRCRVGVGGDVYACQCGSVTVPTLVMPMTCHYLVVPNEIVYDHLGSKDKTYIAVEGAVHNFTPCRPEYGDTVERTFDEVDAWLGKAGRF